TASQWFADTQGSNFVGAFARSVYGGPVPIDTVDTGHWTDGLKYNGQYCVMDPVLNYGERRSWTSLDQAALRAVGGGPAPVLRPPAPPPPAPPPPPPPPPPAPSLPPVGGSGRLPVLVSGTGGAVYVYARGSDGNLAYTGQSFTPFPGFAGTVRTAVADFNADGVADYAFATGPGTGARGRAVD